MFSNLTNKLQTIFKNLKGQGVISESNIKEGLREIQLALLEADVNYRIVKDFIDDVAQEALGQKVAKSITPSQKLVKIVHDKLIELLGKENSPLKYSSNPPDVIMLIGLQGSGKTTTSSKLAKFLHDKGQNILLAGTDTQRPAAREQLQFLGKNLGIPVITEGKTPLDIAINAVKKANAISADTLIIDTQGRLHINEELMDELANIKKAVSPCEILLVADAMTGQDAVNIAKSFNERLGITGVILTKLDTDTRGGAAISIRKITGVPIKFAAAGEKTEDLEIFYPERMASRILGMGDILTLVEKAESEVRKDDTEKLVKKLKAETLDLEDFLSQLRQMKKIGPLSKMLDYLPVEPSLKNMDISEERYKRIEAIILSMTPEERTNPRIIDGSRRKRIAEGSGTDVQDINQLLKQFYSVRKFIKEMVNKGTRMKRKGFSSPLIPP
ncbi:MAG: signal recognition particle protein [Candidatus Ratteibacteria bacterium]|nr:signal recognition particle protein [Candidatus Ratteibacteria bacterium]